MTEQKKNNCIPGLTRLVYDATTCTGIIYDFNINTDKILNKYDIMESDRQLVLGGKGELTNLQKKIQSTIKDWVTEDNISYEVCPDGDVPNVNIYTRGDCQPLQGKFGLTRLMFDLAINTSYVKTEAKINNAILGTYNLTGKQTTAVQQKNFGTILNEMESQADPGTGWVMDRIVDFTIGYGYPLGPEPSEDSPLAVLQTDKKSSEDLPLRTTYALPTREINTLQHRRDIVGNKKNGYQVKERLVIGGHAFPTNVLVTIVSPNGRDFFKKQKFSHGTNSTWMYSWVYRDWFEGEELSLEPGAYTVEVHDAHDENAPVLTFNTRLTRARDGEQSFFKQILTSTVIDVKPLQPIEQ